MKKTYYVLAWLDHKQGNHPSANMKIGQLEFDWETKTFSLKEGNAPSVSAGSPPGMLNIGGNGLFLSWFGPDGTFARSGMIRGTLDGAMNFRANDEYTTPGYTSPSIIQGRGGNIFGFYNTANMIGQTKFEGSNLQTHKSGTVGAHTLGSGPTNVSAFSFDGGVWLAWPGSSTKIKAGLAIGDKDMYTDVFHGGFDLEGKTAHPIGTMSVQVPSVKEVFIFHQEDHKMRWNCYYREGSTDSKLKRVYHGTVEGVSCVSTGVDCATNLERDYVAVYNKSCDGESVTGTIHAVMMQDHFSEKPLKIQDLGIKCYGTPRIIPFPNSLTLS